MKISITDDGPNARVALVGKLDIQGADAVALPLATLAGGKQNILLDVSGVSFLASIGIRHLVSTTKSLSRRGGRLILVAPQDAVREVITTAGLASMILLADTDADAQTMLGSASAT